MINVYVDRKAPGGEPFYVGIGTDARVSKRTRNQWHTGICKKYPTWVREVVTQVSSREAAEELELFLIEEIGRRDLGRGPLVNLTAGGEGMREPSAQLRVGMSRSGRAGGLKTGKANGIYMRDMRIGIHSQTAEERRVIGMMGALSHGKDGLRNLGLAGADSFVAKFGRGQLLVNGTPYRFVLDACRILGLKRLSSHSQKTLNNTGSATIVRGDKTYTFEYPHILNGNIQIDQD